MFSSVSAKDYEFTLNEEQYNRLLLAIRQADYFNKLQEGSDSIDIKSVKVLSSNSEGNTHKLIVLTNLDLVVGDKKFNRDWYFEVDFTVKDDPWYLTPLKIVGGALVGLGIGLLF